MPKIDFSEKELEDFLCRDGNLKKYLGLDFVARQVRTPTGPCDILACGGWAKSKIWPKGERKHKVWYVIELKKDTIDTQSYLQVLRYKHYFDTLKTGELNRHFIPLLIGQHLHGDLNYAVKHFEANAPHYWWDAYYTCFGYDFDKPIAFNYWSISQQKIESAEIYDAEAAA